MPPLNNVHQLLQSHLPAPALEYCIELWEGRQFELKIRKSRITKVGDFTAYPGKVPRITVNHDLDPYTFLLTYVHEVAHLDVHVRHGHRVISHGAEWKQAFQQLMKPLLNPGVFPPPLLVELERHMQNPPASSYTDSQLITALRKLDHRQQYVVLVSDLAEGTVFGLHGRWFQKGKIRRTRFECKELKSKRKYLVPADAPVDRAQLSMF